VSSARIGSSDPLVGMSLPASLPRRRHPAARCVDGDDDREERGTAFFSELFERPLDALTLVLMIREEGAPRALPARAWANQELERGRDVNLAIGAKASLGVGEARRIASLAKRGPAKIRPASTL